MSSRESEAARIFLEAVEHGEPGQRAAFVREAAAGDRHLLQRVDALLKAHGEPNPMLDGDRLAPALDVLQPSEGPGTVIGPYKLLEPIGEGGFGVVFLAEQLQPVRRRVALKVLKPGMDTRQVIARFEAERQALALMDHPNIAHVFDGGETASGRPYFVMELVRGVPITDFCDQNHLSVRERLGLFVSVCRGVQHAHQKGVIHRDLKPSNILVTVQDGRPVPKVIDFGIAKATGQPLTDRTLFTHFAQMVGTPLYMSPEQARMGPDIDTRSDIYSLGVLLYELLTGTTPFDQERLRTAAFDEVRRIIREEEPARPSTRLSTLGPAAATVSANRQSDPGRLSRLVRGELDWVVMKCLEKDRGRRYETAAGLARDLERYLHDEPIRACPPSVGYRVRKFVRRNRAAVAVGGLSLFFLVLLGGGAGWAVRDRAARQARTAAAVQAALDEARQFRQDGRWPQGQAAAERAEALLAGGGGGAELRANVRGLLADFRMVAKLDEVRLARSSVRDGHFDFAGEDDGYAAAFRAYGIDVEALDPRAAAERLGARPIRVELAAALDGWAATRRAVPRPGRKGWQDLLAIARAADPDPWRTALRDAVVRRDRPALLRRAAADEVRAVPPATVVLLARSLAAAGGLPEAVAVLRQAQERHPEDFWINHQLADYLGRMRPPQWGEAVRFYTAAVALRPDSPGARLNFGNALVEQGRPDEALAAYRRAAELKPEYAEAHCNIGLALANQGRFDQALAALRRAIELKPQLAEAHNNVGLVFHKQGRPGEAVAAYRRAIQLKPRSAQFHVNLGGALTDTGRPDEAVTVLRRAVELKPDDPTAFSNLGLALQRQGRFGEAVAACRRAIELKPDDPVAHFNLGLALTDEHRPEDALAAYRRAVELKPDYAEAHCNLGFVFARQDRLDDAIAAFRRASELKPDLARAHFNLGRTLRRQGRLDEAVAAFRRGLERTPGDAEAHYDLGNALREQGRCDEAVAAYRRAIELKPDYAEAYCNLGVTLRQQGKFTAALAALQQGHELGSRRPDWPYPSARWVEECRRLAGAGK